MVASNTYGRQVVVPLTNKSGGGVIAGDVVVVDTANNDAFTTTTTAGFTGGVGVAQETIANNATGRVLVSGYAALVNVNGSITRGNYGKTHTVAKQATDAGASRGVGTFCQFLTGGTTPDALVYPVDLLGSSLTNPMTTTGDIIYSSSGSTPARLAVGGATTFLKGGTTPTWTVPPGTELDYVQFTSPVSITATTEGTATTVVTANAVTFDGSTVAMIEFSAPYITPGSTSGANVICQVNEGATVLGYISSTLPPANAQMNAPVQARLRLTPSAASHTYSIRAFRSTANGTVGAGAGGTGAYVPGFIRIVKVA